MSFQRIAPWVAGLALVAAALGHGQTLTGSIVGTVTDGSGGRLPGVVVTLRGSGIMGELAFTTSETGTYRFPAVPPGAYTVSFSLQGFRSQERANLRVGVGAAARVDAALEVAGVKEAVTVQAENPTVDVDTARVSTNYTQETLKTIPFERDFYSVLKATPGVTNDNASFRATSSISGAGVRNTGYAVDGVNLIDPAAAYAGVRNLNFDTFEEVEVITGAMPAEVPAVGGGFVNIVTKSGSNRMRGGASYYFAGKGLQSDLKDEVLAQGIRAGSIGIDRISDATIELGGPIAKDKVWFYGSYRRLDTDLSRIGFRFERQAITEDNNIPFAKLTYQPSARHKLSVSGGYLDRFQPLYLSTVSPFTSPEANYFFRDRGPWYSTLWQWTLNRNTYVEARYGAMLKKFWVDLVPEGREPATFNLATSESTGSASSGQYDTRHRHQVTASLSHFEDDLPGGSHEFKVGLEYAYASHLQTGRSIFGYQRLFNGTQPAFVTFTNGFPDPIGRYRDVYDKGLYVQDRWRLGRRVTANLGLRVDVTSIVFPEQSYGPRAPFPELQALAIFRPETIPRSELTNWTDVSPRLAISFDLTGNGKTPLKASYSRYAEQVFTYLVQGPMGERTSFHAWTDNNGNRLVEPGEFGPALSTSGAGGASDPGAERPYWSEFILGIERALPANVSVGARVILKENRDIINSVDVGTAGRWFPRTAFDVGPDGVRGTADDVGGVTIYDLEPAFLGRNSFTATNPEGARRKYRALELTASKQLTDRWQLFSSLVISRTEGNISNDYGQTDPFFSGAFVNPNARIHEYGRLGLDSPFQFKAGGTVRLPFDVELGALFTHFTGYPYTRTLRVSTDADGQRLNVGTVTVFAEPRGSRRLPDLDELNLTLAKTFRLGNDRDLRVMADVFNALNAQTTLSVVTLSSATFGRTSSVLPPRYVRFGARFTF